MPQTKIERGTREGIKLSSLYSFFILLLISNEIKRKVYFLHVFIIYRTMN